jgi:antitoxin VapB
VTVMTSRTFKSGNSEAVRLPKDIAFAVNVELTLIKSGDVLTIFRARPPRLWAWPLPLAPKPYT